MKKDMYSPKRSPNEFPRAPTFEATLQAIKSELRTIRGQMEELRLEFERKPPKREAKIKVPSFIGKNDPETYLKWETGGFKSKRSLCGLKSIDTWERLKSAMRLSYAPKAYHQTNHNKVQSRSKLSQIIEDFEKALQYESTRGKIEPEIMSETLGVGQIFPQEMISVIPHTNQRAELEEVVFINGLTLDEYVESWRERLKKIAFEPGDENAYVRGPKQFKKIVFDPGDGDEAIHYVNKVKMKRIVFDPGGDDQLNLRSNSLQEGGDDETQGVTQLFEELVLYFATFHKA
ncbi:hypothetical protein Lal_00048617 [Lupinus albus]|nr:hypothetical protein Lal_00048617 [Lupinus albus]